MDQGVIKNIFNTGNTSSVSFIRALQNEESTNKVINLRIYMAILA